MSLSQKIIKHKIELNYKVKIDHILTLNNSKFIIFFKKRKYIFKISIDIFNKNLFINENKGINFFKKKFPTLKIPSSLFIKKYKKIFILKIKLVKGNKTHYFNLADIIKKNKFLSESSNNIKIKDFRSVLKDNFKTIFLYKLDSDFDSDFDKILKKFNSYQIETSVSHGDFTHHNIINSFKKYHIIDFEYFSKKRIYNYDILHWLISPIVKKLVLNFKINININYFLKLWIKLCFFLFNMKLHNKNLDLYLNLYYLDQKYFFKMTKFLKKKHKIYSKKTLSDSIELTKYYSKLL